jgi:hypothetical protein
MSLVMLLQYCPWTPSIRLPQRCFPPRWNVPFGVRPPVPVEQSIVLTYFHLPLVFLYATTTHLLWLISSLYVDFLPAPIFAVAALSVLGRAEFSPGADAAAVPVCVVTTAADIVKAIAKAVSIETIFLLIFIDSIFIN